MGRHPALSLEDEFIEEACFYLSESRLSSEEIATEFNLTKEQVNNAIEGYKRRLDSGLATYSEETKAFWTKNLRESSGDEKITLVDDKGRYYHGWKSEIEKLPTEQLVELLVVNKQYSDKHPLSEFSKTQPVVGYDPLVPLRNIRHTVSIIDDILQSRSAEED
jgi:hypothetical protein